ncbi:MAG: TetR/AcrR family transcriptional regulator [Hespellia sp.]|nr:TetR/AcrR family transcriptional regulator [Hespellia sp.]
MGKVEENKQQKLNSLFDSAYDLFMSKGIEKTSIHDIVQKAGVAKGTFYLYFKDKYEIRDRLIGKTAEKLFLSAYKEEQQANITDFEDKIVFIVDYIIDQLRKNKLVLRFISKNLSWGIFRKAVFSNSAATELNFLDLYHKLIEANTSVKLRNPEIMLFLIIELASSSCYSTILDNDPITYDELKPDLNASIRSIIQNHMIRE